jgi:divalent metal cation (Fe/Co/Zn/Cd) transporter
MSVQADRAAQVRAGVRVEVFTVLWMIVEAAVSIGAGVFAGSALLVAFGLDSVIELVSGAILLWRLWKEERGEGMEQVERAEHLAAWVVAILLALLCLYVLVTSIYGLVSRARPESSLVGIVIAAAAVVAMPLLGVTKRRLAGRLDSSALRGDAASSFNCGYMAATVLLGVGLNALFQWWWAEYVAALVFLFWLAGETREAFEEARGEKEDKDTIEDEFDDLSRSKPCS